ncbi:hypothetical protein J3R30DRAFT_1731560 [Lentinula aciculospora]|uniref:Uncharacterized protein n=1 Tax=Lentinula aciculospora TaxID=153920 RepID=A0A9W8ZV69_9AGAR|nr:hypothetical protein J3R30DRAFT_1731560 [Lentinula aciculospora]
MKEIIAISHFQESHSMKRSREADVGGTEENYRKGQARSNRSAEHTGCHIGNLSPTNSEPAGIGALALWTEISQSLPAGTDDNNSSFESLSLLPTHSSELGNLPIYESFTDCSMDEHWSFDVAATSSLNSQTSTWLNDNSHIPSPIQMPITSQTSTSQNLLSSYSHRLSFDGLTATSLGIESLPDFSADICLPLCNSAMSEAEQAKIRSSPDVGDALGNQHLNPSNTSLPEWDDWGTYMANVDEILQNMNPRG